MTINIVLDEKQGASTVQDFKKLDEHLSTQQFFHPFDPIESYKKAATLFFDCRRKGLTIRSSIDCLIAQIAIENKLMLLHNDQDFVHLRKVAHQLKLVDT